MSFLHLNLRNMTELYEKGGALSGKLKLVLKRIVSRRTLHGRWLNTLSFMEYIGTRKILKSLPAEILNETLLCHIHEEASHSLFFKRLARKVEGEDRLPAEGGRCFRKEEMLTPAEGSIYFQSLDRKSAELSGGSALLNYLYTTWTLETRATAVYLLYNRILKNAGAPFSLNPVLKDEKKHLQQVKHSIEKIDADCRARFKELKEFEEKAFSRFLQNLEKETLKPESKSAEEP